MLSPGNRVMYHLKNGLERVFVKEELICIPKDTELLPDYVQKLWQSSPSQSQLSIFEVTVRHTYPTGILQALHMKFSPLIHCTLAFRWCHNLPRLPCELWTMPLVTEYLVQLRFHPLVPLRLVSEGLATGSLHYSCVHPSGSVFKGIVRHSKCVKSTPLYGKDLDVFALEFLQKASPIAPHIPNDHFPHTDSSGSLPHGVELMDSMSSEKTTNTFLLAFRGLKPNMDFRSFDM